MDYYDPIAMTDASGEVVERYEFSAFGLRTVMDAAWGPLTDSAHIVEFAFHGQFLDPETGYYKLRLPILLAADRQVAEQGSD